MKISGKKMVLKTQKRYGNKVGWHLIGDTRYFFRSLLEMRYAKKLQFMKDNNLIKNWEHEPDTFYFEGIKRGTTNYKPDFKITELDGKVWYAETKGYMDSKSKTKLNRMAKYHPNIELRVIRSL